MRDSSVGDFTSAKRHLVKKNLLLTQASICSVITFFLVGNGGFFDILYFLKRHQKTNELMAWNPHIKKVIHQSL